MAHYLLVIGDREALGWILTTQRMAFPGLQRAEVRALAPGDTLFLYTTRGCFKNPTRDRGRVIAAGTALTSVMTLDEPVNIAGRIFPVGCDVEFRTATQWSEGIDLASIVADLSGFAALGNSWSIRLRRPLVRLDDRDTSLLQRHLRALDLYPLDEVLPQYARWWHTSSS